jgi:foldase protein PrsA
MAAETAAGVGHHVAVVFNNTRMHLPHRDQGVPAAPPPGLIEPLDKGCTLARAMRRAVLAVLAVLVLSSSLVIAGCGGSSSVSVPDGAVAQAGSTTVTAQQLSALLANAKAYYVSQGQTFPKVGSAEYRKIRAQAISYLVEGAIVLQQAANDGVTVSDAKVDAAIATIKKQNFGGSEKKLEAELKAEGLTPAMFRRQELLTLTEQALQTRLTSKVKVTDAEARSYYLKHPSTYTTPASRKVRHILVAKKPLADSLYAQLVKGADFATLARKYSTDTGSKSQGGALTDTKGSFVPEFEKTAFALKTNEISKPVHSQYGWHIIQALAPVELGTAQPFAKVKSSIEQQLLQTKQSSAVSNWSKNARKTFCNGRVAYGDGYAPLKGQPDACVVSNS